MSSLPVAEEIQDSWVQLNENNEPFALHSIHNGNSEVEKLLTDAQKESRTPSRSNSKESSTKSSPKSPRSPNNEFQDPRQDTDWIWYFSSGPEAQPPSNLASRFKRPCQKNYYSIRNSRVIKNNLFSKENIPTLILTHASCIIGAVLLTWFYMKRYHMVVN